MLLNVQDFPTVDDPVGAAIGAAQDGDRVYLPGVGIPYPAPTGGWSVKRSIEIFGDGPGTATSEGTVIVAAAGANVLTLDASLQPVQQPSLVQELDHVYIHDLSIIGTTGSGTGGNSAIGINRHINYKYDQLRLERLNVARMGGIGIDLQGQAGQGDNSLNQVLIADCVITFCAGAGGQFTNIYMLQVVSSIFTNNGMQGAYVTAEVPGGPIAFHGCLFEQNQLGMLPGASAAADLAIARSGGVHVDGCVFRNVLSTAGSAGCLIDSTTGGTVISGCVFEQLTTSGGTGLRLSFSVPGASGGAVHVLPNRFSNLDVAVDAAITQNISGCVMFPQYCEPKSGQSMAQQLKLPGTGSQGWFGSASVIGKANGTPTSAFGGLLIPAYNNDPTAPNGPLAGAAQLGLMVLVNRGTSPQLRIRTTSGWKTATLL